MFIGRQPTLYHRTEVQPTKGTHYVYNESKYVFIILYYIILYYVLCFILSLELKGKLLHLRTYVYCIGTPQFILITLS
jgi:hypothetical protein